MKALYEVYREYEDLTGKECEDLIDSKELDKNKRGFKRIQEI